MRNASVRRKEILEALFSMHRLNDAAADLVAAKSIHGTPSYKSRRRYSPGNVISSQMPSFLGRMISYRRSKIFVLVHLSQRYPLHS